MTAMKVKLWAGFILLIVIVGAVLYAWWAVAGRWRPHTVARHQVQIAQLLEHAGWVSPGLGGPKLYVVAFRSCPDCIRYLDQELPKLQKAGVDTRVIMVARRDQNGQSRSSAAERATVAELWANRKWSLLQQWQAASAGDWQAPGILPADGDTLRTGAVELSRKLVDDLTPLLKDNNLVSDRFRYPTVIWWDKGGRMRGCVCEDPRTYRYVRRELGA